MGYSIFRECILVRWSGNIHMYIPLTIDIIEWRFFNSSVLSQKVMRSQIGSCVNGWTSDTVFSIFVELLTSFAVWTRWAVLLVTYVLVTAFHGLLSDAFWCLPKWLLKGTILLLFNYCDTRAGSPWLLCLRTFFVATSATTSRNLWRKILAVSALCSHPSEGFISSSFFSLTTKFLQPITEPTSRLNACDEFYMETSAIEFCLSLSLRCEHLSGSWIYSMRRGPLNGPYLHTSRANMFQIAKEAL